MPRSGSYMSVRVSVTSHQDPTKEWVVDARKLYYAFARDDTIILRLLPVKVTSKVRVKKEVEWSLFGDSFEEVEKNASHSGPSGVKKVSGVVRKCSVRKCTTKARSSLDGNPRCHKHGAPRTKCNVKGCTKQAQLRGVADDDFGVAQDATDMGRLEFAKSRAAIITRRLVLSPTPNATAMAQTAQNATSLVVRSSSN